MNQNKIGIEDIFNQRLNFNLTKNLAGFSSAQKVPK
jgi:hypothetical protein